MKKLQYIQPTVEVTETMFSQMLAESGVTGSIDSGDGPGYGGVDDDGNLNPSVKGESWTDIWDN